MKAFKQVESTRRAYHDNAMRNSVHRSSLLVPEMAASAVEISFLNHFLIKRGYPNVACRVTAIDFEGQRIDSLTHPVDEARVYTIPLTGQMGDDVATYMVEFFAAENLFIPFPAVMVNHRGEGFLNTVHAFNRVLNDVFEDSAINQTPTPEASIDVCVSQDVDTVVYFMGGQNQCVGTLDLELIADRKRHEASVPIDVARFGCQVVSLREAFPGLDVRGGVLKVRQPPQEMFYGRLLVGMRSSEGAFVGNHSYYDSSETSEYWDDAQRSERLYPFLSAFENLLRIYPIMSPGRLAISLDLIDCSGKALVAVPAGVVDSPGEDFLEISVDKACAAAGLGRTDIAAFVVKAAPVSGQTPTRINHQLVFTDRDGRTPMAASINVSLTNPNVFQPEGKRGVAWGQAPIGGGVRSSLGIVTNRVGGTAEEIEVKLWGEAGLLATQPMELPAGAGICLDLEAALPAQVSADPAAPAQNIWYEIRSRRPDISAFAASQHQASGICTGEHSF